MNLRRMIASAAIGAALIACGKSDESITSDVRGKLAGNPQLATLAVITKDRVVILDGAVTSVAARSEAERLAHEVKGVKSIDDRIVVVQQPPQLTSAPIESPEERAIRNAVEAKVHGAGVPGVTAEVHDGVVTLRGNVPRASLAKVIQAAHEANPHPKRVDNKLNIQ